jgi:hypothetical protein
MNVVAIRTDGSRWRVRIKPGGWIRFVDACRHFGVAPRIVRQRHSKGVSLQDLFRPPLRNLGQHKSRNPAFDLPWDEDDLCLQAMAKAQREADEGKRASAAMTLREIGALYGLSRERVRQVEEGAFRKLRRAYGIDALRELFTAAMAAKKSHWSEVLDKGGPVQWSDDYKAEPVGIEYRFPPGSRRNGR